MNRRLEIEEPFDSIEKIIIQKEEYFSTIAISERFIFKIFFADGLEYTEEIPSLFSVIDILMHIGKNNSITVTKWVDEEEC